MTPKDAFTQQYLPLASSVGERLNVDPNLLIAQWGLETGWGKSVIPGTNNLGNIKDFSGNGVSATDNMTGSRDKYVKFDTPEAFGDHYVGLINRRYPKVAGTGSDAEAFAQALKAGGYAEDPNYVNKLVATATGMPVAPQQPQGNRAMNTQPSALPNATQMYGSQIDPMAIYQMLMSQQKNVPLQQLTPEQKDALMADRQQRASMLPLAIGAALSGDKRVAAMGAGIAKDAMSARGPQQLGEEGWLTADGQLIENPFTSAKRDETRGDRALNLAIQAANQQTNGQILNMLRAQQIQQATTKNAPANVISGPDGAQTVDKNAPWSNLNNEQAGPLRASTMTDAQKQLKDMREAVQGDTGSIQMMDQFLNLNKRQPTGGAWDKYGPDKLQFGDTAAMLALQNKMTPLQRPAGSGATSDFEQKMYALGIPNITNDYNVNQQTRLANAALSDVRAARLKFYEQYLAQYGHLNGAESAFAPQVQSIEKMYAPKIEALSPVGKKKGSKLPEVQAVPNAGAGALSPDEQRELEDLRRWQAGGK